MAFDLFEFEPKEGFNDSNYYEDSPENSREILQRQHNQTRDYINSLIERLNSVKEGQSGSESIASPSIDGVSCDNVFSQIKDVKRQLTDASVGIIPDGSVNEAKLAGESVSGAKIRNRAVSSEHFSDEATAPFAEDAHKLNGIDGKMFEPHMTAGSIDVFKERFCDTPIYTLRGKTHKGNRYITNGTNKIFKLSLEDGNLTEYIDLTGYGSNFTFAFDENDDVYILIPAVSNKYRIVYVYKYEDCELVKQGSLTLTPDTTYADDVSDVVIKEGVLYFVYCISGTNSSTYFYKIPCAEITESVALTPFYSKSFDKYAVPWPLFFKDDDLYFFDYVLPGGDGNNAKKYPYAFLGYDEGRFLISHRNYYLLDDNLLPCGAVRYPLTEYSNYGFIYKNYVFMLAGDYLFRTRLY